MEQVEKESLNWSSGKPTELTSEDILKLKDSEGIDMVLEICVQDKKAWFKNVDMKTNAAAKAQKTGDGYYAVIAKNCFLGGDQELVNNPKYFHHIKTQLDELVFWLPIEVKKY